MLQLSARARLLLSQRDGEIWRHLTTQKKNDKPRNASASNQQTMKTEKFLIANLKCGGCENTIRSKVSEIDGVESVVVNHDDDSVTITHSGNAKREEFAKKLHSIGYPEATEENGLLLKLKSYASCLVGRVKNLAP